MTVEYDGEKFHGWQKQPRLRTVQGELEKALRKILHEKIVIVGAGRTDAGVHAKGQVAHFETKSRMDAETLVRALNAVSPKDLAVLRAGQAPDSFHARFSARWKCYTYHIWNSRAPVPLARRTTWHLPDPLDADKMKRACKFLAGKHDFSAFQAGPRRPKDCVRHLRRLTVTRKGNLVSINLEANGFLQSMARMIVGTLVRVGRGRMSTREVKRILQSRNQKLAGPNAPPHGLCLERVRY